MGAHVTSIATRAVQAAPTSAWTARPRPSLSRLASGTTWACGCGTSCSPPSGGATQESSSVASRLRLRARRRIQDLDRTTSPVLARDSRSTPPPPPPPPPPSSSSLTSPRSRPSPASSSVREAPPPDPSTSSFLIDRHRRSHNYLRISLTERCNLRCVYCMPEQGMEQLTPNAQLLTAPEIERLAALFVSQGVDKIRLTGGEPTVRKDLEQILASLNELKSHGLRHVGMTTNGLTLSRHLPMLRRHGLTHLNVSLDTLRPERFELLTRRPARLLANVLRGLDDALADGIGGGGGGSLERVKVNVVVLRGVNDGEDVLDFVEWARTRDVVVRFIEYMPFDGNQWRRTKLVPYTDLLALIRSRHGELERADDERNDTSKHWRVPGHLGQLGFITSMTDHFCDSCNRLRITADGNLKVCLFGKAEVSLRDAMRRGVSSTPGKLSVAPIAAGGEADRAPVLRPGMNPGRRGDGSDGDVIGGGVGGGGGCGRGATDSELLRIVGAAVASKHARHGGMRGLEELAGGENRSMIRIGG